MTKWYIALPFALLALLGVMGLFALMSGLVWGLVLLPLGAAGFWFFATRYRGTTG